MKREQLTENFYRNEFACNCGCGFDDISIVLVRKLQYVRDVMSHYLSGKEQALRIDSGCRCPEYNKKVGGKPNSAHLSGMAADIRMIHSRKRFLYIQELLKIGFVRIGVYHSFVHADIHKFLPQSVIWVGAGNG